MRNLTTALLFCSLSWISVSVSEFYTVDVQPGEDVTLLCSNFSSVPSQIFWFRVVKRSKPHCISSMFQPLEPASFCEGSQNDKFEMRSNISTFFLKIKQLDLTDSGLYFCGYYVSKNPIIVSATYLEVQEDSDGITKLMSVILGGLTVFLIIVVIGPVVKIKKLQTELDFEDVNDAALSLYSATIRIRRSASERKVETEVIYAASR
ncbi:uncharacterized protein LOC121889886 [Thunnus maccoyii]|uniref:uncharacterized protein LOC121889886 n=1 Tax=Thunnus maccoyii TaxID=8240 RepID=UPI001C4C5F40|nr:uncharacterized protein LOC121889886 [Thunnus maccoyii]